MKISITRPLPGNRDKGLDRYYTHVAQIVQHRPLIRDELRHVLSDCEVLVCTLTDRLDAELINGAPRLSCVITYSAGVDHIDVAALRARNIPLVHTPDVLTEATADLTWTLILGCARRVKAGVRKVESGHFVGFDPGLCLGLEMRGAVLGIVGYGKIGRAVAHRAKGFGMTVLTAGSSSPHPEGAQKVELETLLSRSDVVTLHCPLTEKTRYLIGRRELGIMKERAILINTARGPVVDEKALLAHLRTRPEFQAGLDVFENEPILTAGLASLPNALCLPHIGSASLSTREAMAELCFQEAIRFAKGEKLQYEYRGGQ